MIPEIEGEGGTLPARSQSRFGNAETRIGPKKINSRNDCWEQRLSWLEARGCISTRSASPRGTDECVRPYTTLPRRSCKCLR